MESFDLTSIDTKDPERLRLMYHYFSSMPIAGRDCPECDGHGFVRNDSGMARCGCMPPFVVMDTATGTIRHGSLVLDGRLDGQPISHQEAEFRHREAVRIADKAFAKAQIRVAGSARPEAGTEASRDPADL